MNTKTKNIIRAAGLLVVGLALGACNTNGNTSQAQGQKITETYSKKLSAAQPYPVSQMNDSAERSNLRERLLRLNNPAKIGYLYELAQNGQVIGYYTIKGKPSSTSSQLTPTQNIYDGGGSGGGGNVATESMGDDGSYGPEEQGIFFFTSSGVLVEWSGMWQYSDAPLHLSQQPLITLDANAHPSTTAGQLKP
jgi:hypothetical protein